MHETIQSSRTRKSLPFATLVVLASAVASAAVIAQAAPAATRGELLYTTQCIACHTTQIHWRSGKLATDWASLRAQVRRWQAAAALQWSDADIDEVAHHLNNTIYRFAQDALTRR